MALKRLLREGGEEDSELPVKRRHFISTIFKGLNTGRALEESLPCLEPMIRKVVQEEVKRAIDCHQGSSYNQIDSCRSRNLQLKFQSDLHGRLFTGSKILSEDGNPIKVALYNSISNEIVKSGPHSSLKVTIVVLDGDFGPGDREHWTKKEFDSKIVKNREGKRPLVTGESIVTLQGGVGYIGEINFTDNSSWIRSGKFRLGAKVNNDELGIREAMSNAFKVKDHRGESYQKHYPPLLDDEVWRLERIAKDGSSHKKLSDFQISSVRDFLRLYVTDHSTLRNILKNASEKTWGTIIRHATTCTLDDEKYLYRPAQGTGLLFNSIYKVVGVTFDGGQNYLSVDGLNMYQKTMVENLKRLAYKNTTEWVSVCDPLIAGYPLLLPCPVTDSFTNPNLGFNGIDFRQQDLREPEMNPNHPTLSPPYRTVIEHDSSFVMGETYRYGSNINNSPGGLYIGGHHSWASGGNYVGPHVSTDDLPIDDNFQFNSSPWQSNGLFFNPNQHQIGISANPGFPSPRKGRPRTRWCKVLAVLKWRIVRRNVAARKYNHFYSYM